MQNNALISLKEKTLEDDFAVEYEILPAYDCERFKDDRKKNVCDAISSIDEMSFELDEKIAKLNTEIDRLTNHADGLDYAIAVISGIIAGLVDIFFVGETEIDKEKIQKLLEEKYHTANDNGFKHKNDDGTNISSPMYHRLDDLAHHPTLLGLAASILARYLRLVIYIDGSDGKPHIFFSDTSKPEAQKKEMKDLIKAWIGAIIGGICLWLTYVAENKYEEKNQQEMPEPLKKLVRLVGSMPMIIELLKAVDMWVGHMMSDVSTPMGIPGFFLSLLKEISVLPFLRNTNLPVYVDKLYRLGEHNLNEWGGVIFTAAKKQSIPVLINEVITRSFYLIRHIVMEYKKSRNWISVNWENVFPFGNRTIVRMMTIASGTFTAVDLLDATIEGCVKGGAPVVGAVPNPKFFKEFLLRVNFVGIGRFVIAVGTDIGMGVKRQRLIKERMQYRAENNMLQVSKIYYLQEDMWIEAVDTQKAINDMCETAEKSIIYFAESWNEMSENLEKIQDIDINQVEENNAGLIDDLKDIFEW